MRTRTTIVATGSADDGSIITNSDSLARGNLLTKNILQIRFYQSSIHMRDDRTYTSIEKISICRRWGHDESAVHPARRLSYTSLTEGFTP
jgi:hypothetical protein